MTLKHQPSSFLRHRPSILIVFFFIIALKKKKENYKYMTAEVLGSSDQMAMQNIMVGFSLTNCFLFSDFFDTFAIKKHHCFRKNIIASSQNIIASLVEIELWKLIFEEQSLQVIPS